MSTATTLKTMLGTIQMPIIVDRAALVAWLQFVHGVMRASAPLLEIAVSKSDGALRDYYREHLVEERDHADWLAADLKTLGADPLVMDHAVACVAGSQYYYLNHVGPHPFLGYMAALEFRPMPIAAVEQLAKAYGEEALRTVRYHAHHDLEHREALAQVIDRCEEFADLIVYNATLTARTCAFYLSDRTRAAGGV